MKMQHNECRFVIGPANILFAGVCACTLHPRTLTASGSEGVKYKNKKTTMKYDFTTEIKL